MMFFFPDSQDQVDPSFDFETETRAEFRIRQRDDRYAHEIFAEPPFDGVLVSKAIVDGSGNGSARYTLAQRHRLLRVGIREFLRLDSRPGGRHLKTLGDCGAFTYKDEDVPPFTPEEVVSFYDECDFDLGVSVDHAILAYVPEADDGFVADNIAPELRQRQELTLDLADEFLKLRNSQGCRFEPLGVAQGWSPSSYAHAVSQLQRMGYTYIALGGMVPLKTREVLAVLERVSTVRKANTRFHLLGITRTEHLETFREYGVSSFDSTSPFMQAFKDDRDNYYTPRRTYVAIRVPQVEGNAKLLRRIRAGAVDQKRARDLEQRCLAALRAFDRGDRTVTEIIPLLREYEQIHDDRKDRSRAYHETLEAKPWKSCPCDVCRKVGIEVIIFRGSERNKRRGFHNLSVFYRRLHHQLGLAPSSYRSGALVACGEEEGE